MLATESRRKMTQASIKGDDDREGPMSHYTIHFLKDVLGENGRQLECCQRTVEIDAVSEDRAIELAKTKFCEMQALRHWSLHADRIVVAAASLRL